MSIFTHICKVSNLLTQVSLKGGGGDWDGFEVVRRTVPRSARKVSKMASKFFSMSILRSGKKLKVQSTIYYVGGKRCGAESPGEKSCRKNR